MRVSPRSRPFENMSIETGKSGVSQYVSVALKKGLRASVGRMEALNRRFSLVGHQPILDPSAFPWIAEIERDWRSVRAELDEILKYPSGIPNFQDVSVEQ